ncbi:MAG: SDR family NAD(P)-dependent oxidoreductase [Kiritimatiellia bacterium]
MKEPVYVPVLQSELLKGRRALITGGTAGIGLAIAKAYLSAGACVIITGRSDERLVHARQQLMGLGTVDVLRLDSRQPDSFASSIAALGEFDILVNNAGFVGGGVFGATAIEQYDQTLETNLRGPYFLSQCVAEKWIADGIAGNILNVCSASSLRPGNSPYILSKWALRALTTGMAKMLIKHGIVVNGIAPGCTNTEQFSPDGNLGNRRNPSGRLVTVEEVANMAVILASSLCRMVVGDVLYLTGGGAITTIDD